MIPVARINMFIRSRVVSMPVPVSTLCYAEIELNRLLVDSFLVDSFLVDSFLVLR